MTEQETRGKIFNIIREFNVKKRRYSTHTEPSDDEELADALIAAGIGDVKDLQVQVDSLEITNIALQAGYGDAENDRLYWVNKYKEAEHRAEVAERALKNACEDVKGLVSFLIELSERVDGLRVEDYLPEESEPKAYINRAEKELAEEGKDEK